MSEAEIVIGRGRVAFSVVFVVLAFACLAATALAATINGSAKGDVLRGTAKADKIYGKAGSDKVLGLGGNDYLSGGPGNDALAGGAGADKIICGPGNDTAFLDRSDTYADDCEILKGERPANVISGLYCGFTNQGRSMCFTVTADRRSFAQAHFGARVDCQPQSTQELTIDFPGMSPMDPDGSFDYTVRYLTASSQIDGLVGSYVHGTVDAAGNAQGTMHLTRVSFTSSGTDYACDTADATWTAKKQ